MLTLGFLPLLAPLLPLAVPLLAGGIGIAVNKLDKKKKISPITDALLPQSQPQQPQPVYYPPPQAQPVYNPPQPINAPAVPFDPLPINVPSAEPSPVPQPIIPKPAKPIIAAALENLTPSLVPPVTMMTTNYAVRGTDNVLRQINVPSRPLQSGESIKVRITFYAATNKAGLAGCGLDTNSSNYLGSFGNTLVPYKSVAASIGNFGGKNAKYTVSPENHPVFKKQQKIKIPELTTLLNKQGIAHDGIYSVDDTGQDVVAQVSENGNNPVIDLFVPDCLDIQNLKNSIKYATVTVI